MVCIHRHEGCEESGELRPRRLVLPELARVRGVERDPQKYELGIRVAIVLLGTREPTDRAVQPRARSFAMSCATLVQVILEPGRIATVSSHKSTAQNRSMA